MIDKFVFQLRYLYDLKHTRVKYFRHKGEDEMIQKLMMSILPVNQLDLIKSRY